MLGRKPQAQPGLLCRSVLVPVVAAVAVARKAARQPSTVGLAHKAHTLQIMRAELLVHR